METTGDRKVCSRCNGSGGVYMKLRNLGGRNRDGVDEVHYVVCPQPGCNRGYIDPEEHARHWGHCKKERA